MLAPASMTFVKSGCKVRAISGVVVARYIRGTFRGHHYPWVCLLENPLRFIRDGYYFSIAVGGKVCLWYRSL